MRKENELKERNKKSQPTFQIFPIHLFIQQLFSECPRSVTVVGTRDAGVSQRDTEKPYSHLKEA